MDIFLFRLIVLVSIGFFFLPKKYLYIFALILQLIIISVTTLWAINSLSSSEPINILFSFIFHLPVYIIIDRLSAFFILVINFTMLTGLLFASGYLKPYYEKKSTSEIAFHFFNYLWLHMSMLFVCMFRDALAFLIAWEVMSLSSFFLVIFESEKEETLRTGIKYLIQMHIGFAFIFIGFLFANQQSDAAFNFDGLSSYFYSHRPLFLFLLFFTGFGIKAGFIPLHTWLPHAHPAAPSHVSGVMSGVMIKMGIYGILRVLTYIHTDLIPIGLFLLSVSLLSGILGVTLAIVQHDLKKLLAYHSIENIGIIGIGIGLGILGIALNIPVLAVLGFAGGILHILNHSLFKSLLFYASGNVYSQTHTRVIDQLGGLIKKMPKTAIFFLLGALAICGLPPFNGFISEFLIYSGMFKSMHNGDLQTNLVILGSIVGLVLIGGLAIFCFTKVFSVVFLGSARKSNTDTATEVGTNMLLPNLLISAMILLIGFLPFLIIKPLGNIVSIFVKDTSILKTTTVSLVNISMSSLVILTIVSVLWFLRSRVQKRSKISFGPTWSCGYTGANPAIHQYTAASFANNLQELAGSVTHIKKSFNNLTEEDIFPKKQKFETHTSDTFELNLVKIPARKILAFLKKSAIFQTGNLQHYLLYALIFILIIFLLSIFQFM
jgi:hydrogenase-4 component B